MAPTAQAPAKRATYDGSRSRFQSLEAWLNVYGNAEYAIYKRDAAPNVMSYEDWSKSEHVLGPFLWYTTLDVWEEYSSSDEESEEETPKITARAPPKQQPKKLARTNGHKKRGSVKMTTAVAHSKSEDAAASAKRKRKPKKPYLSEDIVVSDVSDEVEESAPVVEASPSTVTIPTSPTNGRRKSGGRKKKQYLSAEIISPEDEDDDPMTMNGVAATTASLHEPIAPTKKHTQVAAATPEPHKGKRGRKSKKKSLSQAILSRDDDEHVDAPADAATTPKNAAASPEGPGSSSRRGLRTRTPAQQRPYFHNTQVYDELVSDEPDGASDAKPSPPKAKQKLKLTNLAQVSYPEAQEAEEEKEEKEEETMLMYDENDDDNELVLDPDEPRPPRKAHYKGKGRAWKKTSDDEDEDYKSPVRVKSNQPKRMLGRRKSTQTTEVSADVPEIEELTELQQQDEQEKEHVEPFAQMSAQKASKKQRKPRRIHHLSEEFVRDDSDTAREELKESETKAEPEKEKSPTSTIPIQKTPKKGRGRPRKSDQDSTPRNYAPQDPINLVLGGNATPVKKKSPPEKRTPKNSAEMISLSDSDEGEKCSETEAVPEDRPDDFTQPEIKESSKPVTPPGEAD